MMDLSKAGPPTTGSKRSRNDFSSSDARGNRSRANSLENFNDEEFIKPKSTRLSTKVNRDKKNKDDPSLVLLIDGVSLSYSNREKAIVSAEIHRIAPTAFIKGIFYMPRGGIKIVCNDFNSKKAIYESQFQWLPIVTRR